MSFFKNFIKTFYPVIFFSIVFLLCGSLLGVLVGVKILCPKNKTEIVTSKVVLNKIEDQSFLITKSVILYQESKITIDQGSAWSNFWWGHEISANAPVSVDVGVDLTKLQESDIHIDNLNKIISINLPQAQIYKSSINGDIEVSTKSGVFKTLFASDTNEDYNLALQQLTSEASKSIEEDLNIINLARDSAIDILQIVLKDLGYTVELSQ